MTDLFNRLWDRTRGAFAQQRTHERARRLAIGSLLCLGRHTLTGLIGAGGCQFLDWSADYRLFERERFDADVMMQSIQRAVVERLPATDPVVTFMDDTLLRKRGRKVAGTSWRRDPLGPAFCNNFIWGQRFLQISAALPERPGASRARAIPIDVQHCPSPRKPSRRASEEDWKEYRRAQKESHITQRGVERLHALRRELDRSAEGRRRRLVACVDGSYTNRTVLKSLPLRTTVIGRVRKDAKLYKLPSNDSSGRGRKRCYGERAATPEALRQDGSIPWQTASAAAAGKVHSFQYKTMSPVRWRNAGGECDLRIIAIRPLAYRLSRQSRLLYRNPVYLVCTDPDLPVEQLIQYYIWRWEIEINFRDEKTLLGMEQAQVRTPQAVASVPVFVAAAYAMLLLAGEELQGCSPMIQAFTPKWRTASHEQRPSTAQLISLFRQQLWGLAIQPDNFSRFVNDDPSLPTVQNFKNSLHHAILFAHG